MMRVCSRSETRTRDQNIYAYKNIYAAVNNLAVGCCETLTRGRSLTARNLT